VPKSMRRDGLGDFGRRGRILTDEVNAAAIDRPPWDVALKEIGRGSVGLPIPAQKFKQFRGKENEAILVSFALTHDDHLSVAIDIGDAKVGGLRGAQARGIDCRENRVMFEVGGGLKQREHFRLTEYERQLFDAPGIRDELDHPLSSQRLLVKEAQSTDGLNDCGPGDLELLNQKELVFTHVIWSE